jgi:hypothetical protein
MIQIQYSQLVQKIITPIDVSDDTSTNIQTYHALWDTGAVKTIISPKIVSDLNLPMYSYQTAKIRIGNGQIILCDEYIIIIVNNQNSNKSIRLSVAELNPLL